MEVGKECVEVGKWEDLEDESHYTGTDNRSFHIHKGFASQTWHSAFNVLGKYRTHIAGNMMLDFGSQVYPEGQGLKDCLVFNIDSQMCPEGHGLKDLVLNLDLLQSGEPLRRGS